MRDLSKTCFVISPIGQPNTEIRENADAVLEYIIKPACDAVGIEAVRSDAMKEPGKITDQMIRAILESRFCVADLSGHNPNVFYEVAIAQAARRPLVLMKIAGEPIPFDVKDYRVIEYDLMPKSIKTDKYVPIVEAHLRALLQPDYTPPDIVHDKSLLNQSGFASYIINEKSRQFGDAPRFLETVRAADEYCYLMGISLKSWGKPDAADILEGLNCRGIDTRVLLMTPENPALESMINSELPAQNLSAVRIQIQDMAAYFLERQELWEHFRFRRMRSGMPHFQIVLTDKTALVLQYMFGRGTQDSPLQQFPGLSRLHTVFKQEFEALWQLNETPEA